MSSNEDDTVVRKNSENESLLIAVPLQVYQQAIQNNTFLVDQNYIIKQLSDGSIVLDTQVDFNNFYRGINVTICT